MRNVIAVVLMSLAMASTAQALTFKKGEVLGSDGEIYHGASPEQMERLIERAAAEDMPAGVVGNNVFVVVGDKVSFVPTSANCAALTKDKPNFKSLVTKSSKTLLAMKRSLFEQVEALNEASEATGQDISELLSEGGIEGLDADLVAELEKVASETGIDFDNLVAVNTVLETLPDDQVDQLMDDLGQMIEEGFADEINETITALSEIEGGLENALNFNSWKLVCQAASNCERQPQSWKLTTEN